MATKSAMFKLDRETKGAVRYQEDSQDGAELIGQLYIRKSGLLLAGIEGIPQQVQVAVLTGEDIVKD